MLPYNTSIRTQIRLPQTEGNEFFTCRLCYKLGLSSLGQCRRWRTEAEFKEKHVCGTLRHSWLYNLTLCRLQRRLQHMHGFMGNPMPESTKPMPQSTLSPSQRLRIWPQNLSKENINFSPWLHWFKIWHCPSSSAPYQPRFCKKRTRVFPTVFLYKFKLRRRQRSNSSQAEERS